MKVRHLGFGVVLAGLSLVAAPALAQSPKTGEGSQSGARSNSSGSSSGPAVERGGGGGGGGAVSTSSSGGGSANSSGGASNTFSSPSTAVSGSPMGGFRVGAGREAAPSHRFSEQSGARTRPASGSGQSASPRSGGGSSSSGGERAVPRGGSASGGNTGSNGSGRTSAAPSNARPGENNASGAREVPSWSRPRGDRPVTGTAVTRTGPLPDRNGGRYYGGGYYYDPFFYGGGRYGYGRYGYGYGYYPYYSPYGFGLGYGLYSGLGWNPYYGDPFGDAYGYGGYGGYSSSRYYQDQGHLKLKVKPRHAKVYVDGYFVGNVDSFDGAFQKLALNGGRHKVEVKAEGYETAEFDVLITPDQTITFQGELKRIQ